MGLMSHGAMGRRPPGHQVPSVFHPLAQPPSFLPLPPPTRVWASWYLPPQLALGHLDLNSCRAGGQGQLGGF